MDWWVVLEIFIGAGLAVGFVILVENLRKPKLVLTIDNPQDHSYPAHANKPAETVRTLRLIVENRDLPRLAKWMSRNTASRCYGFITFYHLNDGQEVFGRSMPIKWSKLPGVQRFPDGRLEAYTFDSVKYIEIHAGYTEILDVTARYDNDAECYGWCYDNYFSNPLWRNPDWKLNSGRYLVKVEVICAGGHCVDLFRLINDVPVNAFRLENAQPDDDKKVKKP
ncbi:MAG: hypothetical protein GH158_02735 [Dehalococcoidia bacterium]|nr:hypothetical protein [Dehalococcoidia bacterium]